MIKPPETAMVAPQKASRFRHPERRIAPAIGLPMSNPNDIGRKSIPLRVPYTLNEGDNVKTMVGGSETKLPVKNLLNIY